MKKVTDDLQMLADHIANAKERLKIAEQGIKERMEASIHQSQGDAKARREVFMVRSFRRPRCWIPISITVMRICARS